MYYEFAKKIAYQIMDKKRQKNMIQRKKKNLHLLNKDLHTIKICTNK